LEWINITRRKRRPSSETGVIYRDGVKYEIYDAFPTKALAKKSAKDTRKSMVYPEHKTKAIVHDMGKNAGRLRHGIFTRKGKRVKKKN